MKIFNLRFETNVKIGGGKTVSRVVCDIDAQFTKERQLWFSVDEEYGNMLTADVYDAFMVAAIYPAMYYGEDIEIDGNVSKKLHYNAVHYAMPIVRDYARFTHRNFNPVQIKVAGYARAEKEPMLHVGTGFSGGVDSFSTLTDHYYNETDEDYKIDTLFFFHVGQYGNVKNPLSQQRADNRFTITRDYAKLIGVKAVMMNTNLFDVYLPEWEYSGGLLIRIASVLVFQKGLKRYYISNTGTNDSRIRLSKAANPDMAEYADPIMMPMFSPDGLDIVCDGEQYKRTEKTRRIMNNPHVQQFLNVCVNSDDEHVSAKNCSICSKCLRTLFALDTLGVLNEFKDVFDLNEWKKRAFKYKCVCLFNYDKDLFAKENIDLAREMGKPLPPVCIAKTYTFCYTALSLPYRAVRKLVRIIKKKQTLK